MAKNLIQNGRTILFANGTGSTIPSGTPVSVGGRFCGVACEDILDGTTGVLDVTGVYSFPAKTGVTIAQGDKVFWDSTPGEVTKTPTDVPLGSAWTASDGTAGNTINVSIEDAEAQAADSGNLTSTNLPTLATAGGNTYTDAAVNVVITALEARLDASELKYNTMRNALRAAGIMV